MTTDRTEATIGTSDVRGGRRIEGLPDQVVIRQLYLGCLSQASYLVGDASTGRAIAALSISGPASRISRSDHPRIGRIVREVAERARRALGFAGRGESPKDGNA